MLGCFFRYGFGVDNIGQRTFIFPLKLLTTTKPIDRARGGNTEIIINLGGYLLIYTYLCYAH